MPRFQSEREADDAPKPNPCLTAGNFRLDGSWDHKSSLAGRGPLYHFVRDLVRARRASKLAPSSIAAQIAASSWSKAFPSLTEWLKESRWNHWPSVPARTSAEVTVKRCGVGATESHWQGGLCLEGEDTRDLPAVECPPQFASALEALLAPPASTPARPRTRVDSQPLAPEPDELWFAQHPEALRSSTTSSTATAQPVASQGVASDQAPAGARGGKGGER